MSEYEEKLKRFIEENTVRAEHLSFTQSCFEFALNNAFFPRERIREKRHLGNVRKVAFTNSARNNKIAG